MCRNTKLLLVESNKQFCSYSAADLAFHLNKTSIKTLTLVALVVAVRQKRKPIFTIML